MIGGLDVEFKSWVHGPGNVGPLTHRGRSLAPARPSPGQWSKPLGEHERQHGPRPGTTRRSKSPAWFLLLPQQGRNVPAWQ